MSVVRVVDSYVLIGIFFLLHTSNYTIRFLQRKPLALCTAVFITRQNVLLHHTQRNSLIRHDRYSSAENAVIVPNGVASSYPFLNGAAVNMPTKAKGKRRRFQTIKCGHGAMHQIREIENA
jgi:hypothetical protein